MQAVCSGCGLLWQPDGHKRCWPCRKQGKQTQEVPTIDPLAQIGENATRLMATLPTHSHHRAPLLKALSQHLPSTTAAKLLHAAPSTVRNAKRKDENSDLTQQTYPAGVKRQRMDPKRKADLCEFLIEACPTKSGDKAETHHQYITDQVLYNAYCKFTPKPVSFNTFHRVKQWMRVRRAGRYLGQFDCSRCILYNKLQHKPAASLTPEEAHNLRDCQLHLRTKNCRGRAISACVPNSKRVSC